MSSKNTPQNAPCEAVDIWVSSNISPIAFLPGSDDLNESSNSSDKNNRKYIFCLILGTIPAVVIGFGAKNYFSKKN